MSPPTSGATARSQSAQRRTPQDLYKAQELARQITAKAELATAAHQSERLVAARRLTR